MIKVTFIYAKNKYETKIESNKTFEDIIQDYSKILKKRKEELYFLYKGKNIFINNEKLSLKKLEKNNNIFISVYDLNLKKNTTKKKLTSQNTICPECKNLAFLNFNEDKITIENCINNHKFNLSIGDFIKSQIIDEKNIKCDFCLNSKSLYNNFYICTCGKKVCQLCTKSHCNKYHILYEYEQYYNICNNHMKVFVSYCSTCRINLCEKCEENHSKHKIIIYKSEIPNDTNLEGIKNEFKINIKKIIEYKKQINKLNNIFNNFIINLTNEMDQYIKLYFKILHSSDNLKNYENLKNILNFKTPNLIRDISYFLLLNDNFYNKFNYLLQKLENSRKEITMIYKVKKDDSKIKIFGKDFVTNNKDKCFLLFDYIIYDLSEYFDIDSDKKIANIKIKLFEEKTINNLNSMFSDCESLSSLYDISKWNLNNIIDMNKLFSGCTSLSSLPDISRWNTEKVTNISNMFSNCKLLHGLPDISKWDTKNVTDMSGIFSNCKLLSGLPDISKWNTINVKNMNNMFSGCFALYSIPDISNWNTINVTDISNMFYYCNSLTFLPDISKWNTNNVINMSHLFHYCNSLPSIPDISKWNTSNVIYMNHMFYGCKSLSNLPQISIWNTSKVLYMNYMFYDCYSLKELPDISNWITKNVLDMSYMFSYCNKLLSLPDISKWNVNNVKDMSYMFYECYTLSTLPNISKWNINNSAKFIKMFNKCSSSLKIPSKFK